MVSFNIRTANLPIKKHIGGGIQKIPQKKEVPCRKGQLSKTVRIFIENLSNILIAFTESVEQSRRKVGKEFHIFCWVCGRVAQTVSKCHHFTFEGCNAVANKITETSQKGIERSQKEPRKR